LATQKQREAARSNIRKAQAAWQAMSHGELARAQPEGRGRAKPGARSAGDYFHVAVRDKSDFVTFRTEDVGEPGHVQRVAGKRGSGSWDTVKWLISKQDAHVEGGTLVPDTDEVRELLAKLGSDPVHVKGNIFRARPRPNVPEREKPTPAQQRARRANITKAEATRRKPSEMPMR